MPVAGDVRPDSRELCDPGHCTAPVHHTPSFALLQVLGVVIRGGGHATPPQHNDAWHQSS